MAAAADAAEAENAELNARQAALAAFERALASEGDTAISPDDIAQALERTKPSISAEDRIAFAEEIATYARW